MNFFSSSSPDNNIETPKVIEVINKDDSDKSQQTPKVYIPQPQQLVIVPRIEKPECDWYCCSFGVAGLSAMMIVVCFLGCCLYFIGTTKALVTSITFAVLGCFYLYVALFYSSFVCRIAAIGNKVFAGGAAILSVIAIIMAIEGDYIYFFYGIGSFVFGCMCYYLGYKYEEFFCYYSQEEGVNVQKIFV